MGLAFPPGRRQTVVPRFRGASVTGSIPSDPAPKRSFRCEIPPVRAGAHPGRLGAVWRPDCRAGLEHGEDAETVIWGHSTDFPLTDLRE